MKKRYVNDNKKNNTSSLFLGKNYAALRVIAALVAFCVVWTQVIDLSWADASTFNPFEASAQPPVSSVLEQQNPQDKQEQTLRPVRDMRPAPPVATDTLQASASSVSRTTTSSVGNMRYSNMAGTFTNFYNEYGILQYARKDDPSVPEGEELLYYVQHTGNPHDPASRILIEKGNRGLYRDVYSEKDPRGNELRYFRYYAEDGKVLYFTPCRSAGETEIRYQPTTVNGKVVRDPHNYVEIRNDREGKYSHISYTENGAMTHSDYRISVSGNIDRAFGSTDENITIVYSPERNQFGTASLLVRRGAWSYEYTCKVHNADRQKPYQIALSQLSDIQLVRRDTQIMIDQSAVTLRQQYGGMVQGQMVWSNLEVHRARPDGTVDVKRLPGIHPDKTSVDEAAVTQEFRTSRMMDAAYRANQSISCTVEGQTYAVKATFFWGRERDTDVITYNPDNTINTAQSSYTIMVDAQAVPSALQSLGVMSLQVTSDMLTPSQMQGQAPVLDLSLLKELLLEVRKDDAHAYQYQIKLFKTQSAGQEVIGCVLDRIGSDGREVGQLIYKRISDAGRMFWQKAKEEWQQTAADVASGNIPEQIVFPAGTDIPGSISRAQIQTLYTQCMASLIHGDQRDYVIKIAENTYRVNGLDQSRVMGILWNRKENRLVGAWQYDAHDPQGWKSITRTVQVDNREYLGLLTGVSTVQTSGQSSQVLTYGFQYIGAADQTWEGTAEYTNGTLSNVTYNRPLSSLEIQTIQNTQGVKLFRSDNAQYAIASMVATVHGDRDHGFTPSDSVEMYQFIWQTKGTATPRTGFGVYDPQDGSVEYMDQRPRMINQNPPAGYMWVKASTVHAAASALPDGYRNIRIHGRIGSEEGMYTLVPILQGQSQPAVSLIVTTRVSFDVNPDYTPNLAQETQRVSINRGDQSFQCVISGSSDVAIIRAEEVDTSVGKVRVMFQYEPIATGSVIPQAYPTSGVDPRGCVLGGNIKAMRYFKVNGQGKVIDTPEGVIYVIRDTSVQDWMQSTTQTSAPQISDTLTFGNTGPVSVTFARTQLGELIRSNPLSTQYAGQPNVHSEIMITCDPAPQGQSGYVYRALWKLTRGQTPGTREDLGGAVYRWNGSRWEDIAGSGLTIPEFNGARIQLTPRDEETSTAKIRWTTVSPAQGQGTHPFEGQEVTLEYRARPGQNPEIQVSRQVEVALPDGSVLKVFAVAGVHAVQDHPGQYRLGDITYVFSIDDLLKILSISNTPLTLPVAETQGQAITLANLANMQIQLPQGLQAAKTCTFAEYLASMRTQKIRVSLSKGPEGDLIVEIGQYSPNDRKLNSIELVQRRNTSQERLEALVIVRNLQEEIACGFARMSSSSGAPMQRITDIVSTMNGGVAYDPANPLHVMQAQAVITYAKTAQTYVNTNQMLADIREKCVLVQYQGRTHLLQKPGHGGNYLYTFHPKTTRPTAEEYPDKGMWTNAEGKLTFLDQYIPCTYVDLKTGETKQGWFLPDLRSHKKGMEQLDTALWEQIRTYCPQGQTVSSAVQLMLWEPGQLHITDEQKRELLRKTRGRVGSSAQYTKTGPEWDHNAEYMFRQYIHEISSRDRDYSFLAYNAPTLFEPLTKEKIHETWIFTQVIKREGQQTTYKRILIPVTIAGRQQYTYYDVPGAFTNLSNQEILTRCQQEMAQRVAEVQDPSVMPLNRLNISSSAAYLTEYIPTEISMPHRIDQARQELQSMGRFVRAVEWFDADQQLHQSGRIAFISKYTPIKPSWFDGPNIFGGTDYVKVKDIDTGAEYYVKKEDLQNQSYVRPSTLEEAQANADFQTEAQLIARSAFHHQEGPIQRKDADTLIVKEYDPQYMMYRASWFSSGTLSMYYKDVYSPWNGYEWRYSDDRRTIEIWKDQQQEAVLKYIGYSYDIFGRHTREVEYIRQNIGGKDFYVPKDVWSQHYAPRPGRIQNDTEYYRSLTGVFNQQVEAAQTILRDIDGMGLFVPGTVGQMPRLTEEQNRLFMEKVSKLDTHMRRCVGPLLSVLRMKVQGISIPVEMRNAIRSLTLPSSAGQQSITFLWLRDHLPADQRARLEQIFAEFREYYKNEWFRNQLNKLPWCSNIVETEDGSTAEQNTFATLIWSLHLCDVLEERVGGGAKIDALSQQYGFNEDDMERLSNILQTIEYALSGVKAYWDEHGWYNFLGATAEGIYNATSSESTGHFSQKLERERLAALTTVVAHTYDHLNGRAPMSRQELSSSLRSVYWDPLERNRYFSRFEESFGPLRWINFGVSTVFWTGVTLGAGWWLNAGARGATIAGWGTALQNGSLSWYAHIGKGLVFHLSQALTPTALLRSSLMFGAAGIVTHQITTIGGNLLHGRDWDRGTIGSFGEAGTIFAHGMGSGLYMGPIFASLGAFARFNFLTRTPVVKHTLAPVSGVGAKIMQLTGKEAASKGFEYWGLHILGSIEGATMFSLLSTAIFNPLAAWATNGIFGTNYSADYLQKNSFMFNVLSLVLTVLAPAAPAKAFETRRALAKSEADNMVIELTALEPGKRSAAAKTLQQNGLLTAEEVQAVDMLPVSFNGRLGYWAGAHPRIMSLQMKLTQRLLTKHGASFAMTAYAQYVKKLQEEGRSINAEREAKTLQTMLTAALAEYNKQPGTSLSPYESRLLFRLLMSFTEAMAVLGPELSSEQIKPLMRDGIRLFAIESKYIRAQKRTEAMRLIAHLEGTQKLAPEQLAATLKQLAGYDGQMSMLQASLRQLQSLSSLNLHQKMQITRLIMTNHTDNLSLHQRMVNAFVSAQMNNTLEAMDAVEIGEALRNADDILQVETTLILEQCVLTDKQLARLATHHQQLVASFLVQIQNTRLTIEERQDAAIRFMQHQGITRDAAERMHDQSHQLSVYAQIEAAQQTMMESLLAVEGGSAPVVRLALQGQGVHGLAQIVDSLYEYEQNVTDREAALTKELSTTTNPAQKNELMQRLEMVRIRQRIWQKVMPGIRTSTARYAEQHLAAAERAARFGEAQLTISNRLMLALRLQLHNGKGPEALQANTTFIQRIGAIILELAQHTNGAAGALSRLEFMIKELMLLLPQMECSAGRNGQQVLMGFLIRSSMMVKWRYSLPTVASFFKKLFAIYYGKTPYRATGFSSLSRETRQQMAQDEIIRVQQQVDEDIKKLREALEKEAAAPKPTLAASEKPMASQEVKESLNSLFASTHLPQLLLTARKAGRAHVETLLALIQTNIQTGKITAGLLALAVLLAETSASANYTQGLKHARGSLQQIAAQKTDLTLAAQAAEYLLNHTTRLYRELAAARSEQADAALFSHLRRISEDMVRAYLNGREVEIGPEVSAAERALLELWIEPMKAFHQRILMANRMGKQFDINPDQLVDSGIKFLMQLHFLSQRGYELGLDPQVLLQQAGRSFRLSGALMQLGCGQGKEDSNMIAYCTAYEYCVRKTGRAPLLVIATSSHMLVKQSYDNPYAEYFRQKYGEDVMAAEFTREQLENPAEVQRLISMKKGIIIMTHGGIEQLGVQLKQGMREIVYFFRGIDGLMVDEAHEALLSTSSTVRDLSRIDQKSLALEVEIGFIVFWTLLETVRFGMKQSDGTYQQITNFNQMKEVKTELKKQFVEAVLARLKERGIDAAKLSKFAKLGGTLDAHGKHQGYRGTLEENVQRMMEENFEAIFCLLEGRSYFLETADGRIDGYSIANELGAAMRHTHFGKALLAFSVMLKEILARGDQYRPFIEAFEKVRPPSEHEMGPSAPVEQQWYTARTKLWEALVVNKADYQTLLAQAARKQQVSARFEDLIIDADGLVGDRLIDRTIFTSGTMDGVVRKAEAINARLAQMDRKYQRSFLHRVYIQPTRTLRKFYEDGLAGRVPVKLLVHVLNPADTQMHNWSIIDLLQGTWMVKNEVAASCEELFASYRGTPGFYQLVMNSNSKIELEMLQKAMTEKLQTLYADRAKNPEQWNFWKHFVRIRPDASGVEGLFETCNSDYAVDAETAQYIRRNADSPTRYAIVFARTWGPGLNLGNGIKMDFWVFGLRGADNMFQVASRLGFKRPIGTVHLVINSKSCDLTQAEKDRLTAAQGKENQLREAVFDIYDRIDNDNLTAQISYAYRFKGTNQRAMRAYQEAVRLRVVNRAVWGLPETLESLQDQKKLQDRLHELDYQGVVVTGEDIAFLQTYLPARMQGVYLNTSGISTAQGFDGVVYDKGLVCLYFSLKQMLALEQGSKRLERVMQGIGFTGNSADLEEVMDYLCELRTDQETGQTFALVDTQHIDPQVMVRLERIVSACQHHTPSAVLDLQALSETLSSFSPHADIEFVQAHMGKAKARQLWGRSHHIGSRYEARALAQGELERQLAELGQTHVFSPLQLMVPNAVVGIGGTALVLLGIASSWVTFPLGLGVFAVSIGMNTYTRKALIPMCKIGINWLAMHGIYKGLEGSLEAQKVTLTGSIIEDGASLEGKALDDPRIVPGVAEPAGKIIGLETGLSREETDILEQDMPVLLQSRIVRENLRTIPVVQREISERKLQALDNAGENTDAALIEGTLQEPVVLSRAAVLIRKLKISRLTKEEQAELEQDIRDLVVVPEMTDEEVAQKRTEYQQMAAIHKQAVGDLTDPQVRKMHRNLAIEDQIGLARKACKDVHDLSPDSQEYQNQQAAQEQLYQWVQGQLALRYLRFMQHMLLHKKRPTLQDRALADWYGFLFKKIEVLLRNHEALDLQNPDTHLVPWIEEFLGQEKYKKCGLSAQSVLEETLPFIDRQAYREQVFTDLAAQHIVPDDPAWANVQARVPVGSPEQEEVIAALSKKLTATRTEDQEALQLAQRYLHVVRAMNAQAQTIKQDLEKQVPQELVVQWDMLVQRLQRNSLTDAQIEKEKAAFLTKLTALQDAYPQQRQTIFEKLQILCQEPGLKPEVFAQRLAAIKTEIETLGLPSETQASLSALCDQLMPQPKHANAQGEEKHIKSQEALEEIEMVLEKARCPREQVLATIQGSIENWYSSYVGGIVGPLLQQLQDIAQHADQELAKLRETQKPQAEAEDKDTPAGSSSSPSLAQFVQFVSQQIQQGQGGSSEYIPLLRSLLAQFPGEEPLLAHKAESLISRIERIEKAKITLTLSGDSATIYQGLRAVVRDFTKSYQEMQALYTAMSSQRRVFTDIQRQRLLALHERVTALFEYLRTHGAEETALLTPEESRLRQELHRIQGFIMDMKLQGDRVRTGVAAYGIMPSGSSTVYKITDNANPEENQATAHVYRQAHCPVMTLAQLSTQIENLRGEEKGLQERLAAYAPVATTQQRFIISEKSPSGSSLILPGQSTQTSLNPSVQIIIPEDEGGSVAEKPLILSGQNTPISGALLILPGQSTQTPSQKLIIPGESMHTPPQQDKTTEENSQPLWVSESALRTECAKVSSQIAIYETVRATAQDIVQAKGLSPEHIFIIEDTRYKTGEELLLGTHGIAPALAGEGFATLIRKTQERITQFYDAGKCLVGPSGRFLAKNIGCRVEKMPSQGAVLTAAQLASSERDTFTEVVVVDRGNMMDYAAAQAQHKEIVTREQALKAAEDMPLLYAIIDGYYPEVARLSEQQQKQMYDTLVRPKAVYDPQHPFWYPPDLTITLAELLADKDLEVIRDSAYTHACFWNISPLQAAYALAAEVGSHVASRPLGAGVQIRIQELEQASHKLVENGYRGAELAQQNNQLAMQEKQVETALQKREQQIKQGFSVVQTQEGVSLVQQMTDIQAKRQVIQQQRGKIGPVLWALPEGDRAYKASLEEQLSECTQEIVQLREQEQKESDSEKKGILASTIKQKELLQAQLQSQIKEQSHEMKEFRKMRGQILSVDDMVSLARGVEPGSLDPAQAQRFSAALNIDFNTIAETQNQYLWYQGGVQAKGLVLGGEVLNDTALHGAFAMAANVRFSREKSSYWVTLMVPVKQEGKNYLTQHPDKIVVLDAEGVMRAISVEEFKKEAVLKARGLDADQGQGLCMLRGDIKDNLKKMLETVLQKQQAPEAKPVPPIQPVQTASDTLSQSA